MLTLEHFFKIQSLPNSPTHHAVIGPLGDPTPRMEHINELCTQYQVQTAKILTNVVPEIPSWTYPPIRNCPFLGTKKQGLLDEEMRATFLAHLERHPMVHIHTDGSSPPKVWALQQCFLTPPVVADLPERLQYSHLL